MNNNDSSFHLSAGGKILIVGAKASNFDPEYREHKQLMFWDSTDPATSRKNYIPKKVEIVLFMKWVNHSLTERLIRAAKQRGVQSLRVVQSPGRIKDIMISLLRESDKERKNIPRLPERVLLPRRERQTPAIPAYSATQNTTIENREHIQTIQGDTPMQTQEQEEATKSIAKTADTLSIKKKAGKGELKKFIEENVDFNAPSRKQEIQRLFSLAQAVGIHTTPNSLSARFSEAKRIRNSSQGQSPTTAPKNSRKLRNPERVLEQFKKAIENMNILGTKLLKHIEVLTLKNQHLENEARETRELQEKMKAMLK